MHLDLFCCLEERSWWGHIVNESTLQLLLTLIKLTQRERDSQQSTAAPMNILHAKGSVLTLPSWNGLAPIPFLRMEESTLPNFLSRVVARYYPSKEVGDRRHAHACDKQRLPERYWREAAQHLPVVSILAILSRALCPTHCALVYC